MSAFGRLFAANPDGQAQGLQEDALQANALPLPHEPKHRQPVPRDLVDAALGQKLLQGWIQNRAQTLHPLTLNLGRLDQAQAMLVLQAMALAVLATGPANAAKLERATALLTRAYGTDEHRRYLAIALGAPPMLHVVMDEVRAADMTGHVYAAVLGAVDQRDPVNRAFAGYLAQRLALPADIGRSLGRRYRM